MAGLIDATSEPGVGTEFSIYPPRHSGKSHGIKITGEGATETCGHETILLVEDEPAILRLTRMMLERQGYNVLAAGNPGEAIRQAQEYPGLIDLLITDVVMPDMNGHDLAENLLSIYPEIKRLFMSGYTAEIIAHHGVLNEGVHFIQKPYSIHDLAEKVRAVLDTE